MEPVTQFDVRVTRHRDAPKRLDFSMLEQTDTIW